MIKILNVEPTGYCSQAKHILKSIGELLDREFTRDELISCLSGFDVLIVRLGHKIDREVIDAGSHLRVIVTATTGLDHIDVSYAQSRDITVLSLKNETEFLTSITATAEHTWALLLSLIRRIPWAYSSVLSGDWNRDAFRGHDLYGKCLGIIGFGRIGSTVAKYGEIFRMNVGGYDPYKEDHIFKKAKRFRVLQDLLIWADVVSLHVPLNEETANLIDAQALEYMKFGSVLINTSRGPVVDEKALIQSLVNHHLGGAALDVICNESNPLNQTSNFLVEYAKGHNNLIITPHIGGATLEAMEKTEIFMAKKLKNYFEQHINL